MELLNNSVWVDASLFPRVDEITILDAEQFMGARLRDSHVTGKTLRLDTAYISWNGTEILGRMPQLLLGLVIPRRRGLTLLRHHLGSEASNLVNIVLDPEQPEVVTLVGPRGLPATLPDNLETVDLDVALEAENFETLHGATKAVISLLKYLQARSPMIVGETSIEVGNGWIFHCSTPEDLNPTFTLEPPVYNPGVCI